MRINEMDIYECIKPVTYGRINYTPDNDVEKSRVIRLPRGTQVDKTISEYFRRKGARVPVVENPVEPTSMTKEAVVESILEPAGSPQIPEVEETLETMEKKFEAEGFKFDKRWILKTAKEEFELALMIKEDNSNEE